MTETALGIDRATLHAEAERRRTFAIISHPDAGKTTLTEKLLLYGGAVQLAGSVTARQSQRRAASDWMALEQQRGISITSTILAFPYRGHQVNLLDTPGHQDFSEDTYRTLTAVDSAVMVLDAARGIEPQTLKLFEVCRMRHTPIFTFINKLDRPGQAPARAAGRDRANPRHEDRADELADRRRTRLPRASTTCGRRPCISSSAPSTAPSARRSRSRRSTTRRSTHCSATERAATLREDVELIEQRRARRSISTRCCGRADAGLLRQRDHQLRRPALPRHVCRLRAGAGRVRDIGYGRRAGPARVHRIRLQDPGQHGSAPPRPRRLPAHLRRPVFARYGGLALADEAQGPPRAAAAALRPGARSDRGGVRRRRHRRHQPRTVRDRRHRQRA